MTAFGPGDDSDLETGRCCPHCRHLLTDHNVSVWNAGYALATRHHSDEVEQLARWKAEALPVMAGLQELGRALGVRLGKSITARESVDLALDLRNERDTALAEAAALRERIAAARAVVAGQQSCPADGCEWDERGTNAGAGPAACQAPGASTAMHGCLIASSFADDTDQLHAVLAALNGGDQ